MRWFAVFLKTKKKKKLVNEFRKPIKQININRGQKKEKILKFWHNNCQLNIDSFDLVFS